VAPKTDLAKSSRQAPQQIFRCTEWTFPDLS